MEHNLNKYIEGVRLIIALSGIIWKLKKGLGILNQIDGLSVMSILECCKKSTPEINDTLLTIVQSN